MMNTQDKNVFDTITAKPVKELTKDDIAFLQARRSYLRPDQTEIYKDILAPVEKKFPTSEAKRKEFEKLNAKAEAAKARAEAEAKSKKNKVLATQNPEPK